MRADARSTYYRWFTDAAARQVFAEDIRERESRSRGAELRATLARRPDEPVRDLVEKLRSESAEFATQWDAHEVEKRTSDRKRILGPTGMLKLYARFLSAGAPEQVLVVFTPVAGTDAAERLAHIG
ncbi:hypothetical protein [Streptomyces sp.]|uniref:MmyB family transcriptional regulator n=1 Tax=Streptomyces sp. TaxID=1931 RepID=UPI0025E1157A|nr:hypothetical protein [Streptomyces sp.]